MAARPGRGGCRTEAGVERISEEANTFELGPGSNSQGQVQRRRRRRRGDEAEGEGERERVMEMRK